MEKDKRSHNNGLLGWGKIGILALLLVFLVRFFILQPYRISSSAMASTILDGDFLLVVKPPFATLDKRNAPILFRSPLPQDSSARTLFISRCIALPGDTLQQKDNQLLINGKEVPRSPHSLADYSIDSTVFPLVEAQLKRLQLPIRLPDQTNKYRIRLTAFEAYTLREELPDFVKPRLRMVAIPDYKIIVPRKGIAYRLDGPALTACKQIILDETDGKASFRDGKLYIDGRETTFFFFKKEYCWVLSDHLMEAIDSRHLGFISTDRIVGQPCLIWMSKDPGQDFLHGYRWKRIFKTIN